MKAMPYLFNEGNLTFAQEEFTDRTVNILTLGHPETSKMNLTISRDELKPNEDLIAYVSRQIGLMEKQIKGYKLIRRWQNTLGSEAQVMAGESIEATHKTNNNSLLYQRQSGFTFAEGRFKGRVIVFSITQDKPFSVEFDGYWQNLLSTFRTHE